MSGTPNDTQVREAVAVFDDWASLEEAADELMSSGFHRSMLSLVAGHQTVETKLGHMYQKVAEVEDDPSVPQTAFIARESFGDAEGGIIGALIYVPAVISTGAVVATGGTLLAAIVAAAAVGTAGASLGVLLSRLLEKHHADYQQEQLERGGLLLWVRTMTPVLEERAIDILKRHSGRDVHIHGLRAA